MFRPNRRRAATRMPTKFDPSAARGALGQAFVQALMTDFERFGAGRLKKLRRQRPHLYFRLVTALLPKEYRIKEVDFSDIADQELQQMLEMLKAAIREKEKEKAPGTAQSFDPNRPC